MDLRPFTCTIRVFHPATGAAIAVSPARRQPDAEHAATSTLANAASFTPKLSADGTARSVAFACTAVVPRD